MLSIKTKYTYKKSELLNLLDVNKIFTVLLSATADSKAFSETDIVLVGRVLLKSSCWYSEIT